MPTTTTRTTQDAIHQREEIVDLLNLCDRQARVTSHEVQEIALCVGMTMITEITTLGDVIRHIRSLEPEQINFTKDQLRRIVPIRTAQVQGKIDNTCDPDPMTSDKWEEIVRESEHSS